MKRNGKKRNNAGVDGKGIESCEPQHGIIFTFYVTRMHMHNKDFAFNSRMRTKDLFSTKLLYATLSTRSKKILVHTYIHTLFGRFFFHIQSLFAFVLAIEIYWYIYFDVHIFALYTLVVNAMIFGGRSICLQHLKVCDSLNFNKFGWLVGLHLCIWLYAIFAMSRSFCSVELCFFFISFVLYRSHTHTFSRYFSKRSNDPFVLRNCSWEWKQTSAGEWEKNLVECS